MIASYYGVVLGPPPMEEVVEGGKYFIIYEGTKKEKQMIVSEKVEESWSVSEREIFENPGAHY